MRVHGTEQSALVLYTQTLPANSTSFGLSLAAETATNTEGVPFTSPLAMAMAVPNSAEPLEPG